MLTSFALLGASEPKRLPRPEPAPEPKAGAPVWPREEWSSCPPREPDDRCLVGIAHLPPHRVTHLATCGVEGFEVLQQAVGGAPASDPDEDFGVRGVRYLFQCGRQDPDVIGDRVRVGIARPQLHWPGTLRRRAPGHQRMEPEGLLERDRRQLLLRGGGDDRGVEVDDDPARQTPARQPSARESPRAAGAAGTAHAGAPDGGPSPPAPASSRRVRPGSGGRWSPRRADRTTAGDGAGADPPPAGSSPQRDRHRELHQQRRLVLLARAAHRQHPRQRLGQPDPVRTPPQQCLPGVSDQPLAVGPHGRPPVPTCTRSPEKCLDLLPDTSSTNASLQVNGTFLLSGRQPVNSGE